MSELINQISKLSISERIQLVQEILATISSEEELSLSKSQLEEIERRSESISTGKAKTVSWDKVQQAINERYGL